MILKDLKWLTNNLFLITHIILSKKTPTLGNSYFLASYKGNKKSKHRANIIAYLDLVPTPTEWSTVIRARDIQLRKSTMAKALKERQSSIQLRWQTVSTIAQAISFHFGP